MKKQWEQFSVVETKVEMIRRGSQKIVEKRYMPNVPFKISPQYLRGLIENYYGRLKRAGIPLPKVLKSFVRGKEIVFLTAYAGKNLLEKGLTPLNFESYLSKIRKMMEILRLAADGNLMIDPHLKNFVFQKTDIAYVDVYPPYTEEFIKRRLQVAEKNEIKIIEENFKYFSPAHLAAHFVGDLLGMNVKYRRYIKELYEMALRYELYEKSLREFEHEAVKIRKLENLRLEKGIFLV